MERQAMKGLGGMGRGRGGEKPKDLVGTWKKLLGYCKAYLTMILIAVACAIAGTVLTLLGPDKLSEITTLISGGILTGIDMDAVQSICMTLVCFYVASFLLSLIQNWVMSSVTQSVTKKCGEISPGRSISFPCGTITALPPAMYSPG